MEETRNQQQAEKMEMEKGYLYWLLQLPWMGSVTLLKLYKVFGSYECVYYIEETDWKKAGVLEERKWKEILKWRPYVSRCLEELQSLDQKNIHFIPFWDERYPKRLLQLYDFPAGLFLKGKLPDSSAPTAAVIGARNCTNYGRQTAAYMARTLAEQGIVIVSGLARGADGAAHQGALEGGGKTLAVLGSGIDICYPKENYPLYRKLETEGAILSEYPLSCPPRACNFPMRNRIISGLSDVILVTEAREKSGTLITVSLGLEQGKEIFALPGRITDPLSAGCNRLLREGANPLLSPDDVLEYFSMAYDKMLRVHEKNENGLAKKEKMVYSCLDLHPRSLEEIVMKSGLSIGECMDILIKLEYQGYILQTSYQYYGKKL